METESAVQRIERFTLILALAGAAFLLAWRGWRWAAGYLVGALAGYLNFHVLKRVALAVGEASAGKPVRMRSALFLGLRYFILGGGAYVILKYSSFNVYAALIGLFVAVAAVILEILYELVFS